MVGGSGAGQGTAGGGVVTTDQGGVFKARHFTTEVILWALRWYLAFPISYRDLAVMLADRALRSIIRRCFAGCRPMPRRWRSGSVGICGHAPAPDGWTRRISRSRASGPICIGRWTASPDDRLPAFGPARCGSGQVVLPQGAGAAAHRQPAHDHGGQEPGRPACRDRDEANWRTVALLAPAAVQVSEHHRRAGPQADQTAGSAGARLRPLSNRQADTGRLRGDGDDPTPPASFRLPPEFPTSETSRVSTQRLQHNHRAEAPSRDRGTGVAPPDRARLSRAAPRSSRFQRRVRLRQRRRARPSPPSSARPRRERGRLRRSARSASAPPRRYSDA